MAEIERPKPAARRKTRNRSSSPAANAVFDESAVPDVTGLHELLTAKDSVTSVGEANPAANGIPDAHGITASSRKIELQPDGLTVNNSSHPTTPIVPDGNLDSAPIQFIEDEASVATSETDAVADEPVVEREPEAVTVVVVHVPVVEPTHNEPVHEITYPSLSSLERSTVVETANEQREIAAVTTENASYAQLHPEPAPAEVFTPDTVTQSVPSVYAEVSRLIETERPHASLAVRVQQPLSVVERQQVYRNVQLDLVKPLVDRFLEFCTRSRESHPFLILLRAYLQYLNELDETRLRMDALRKDYDSSRNSLWKTVNKSVTGTGRCGDGKQVSATHRFRQSIIDEKSYQQLTSASEHIRTLIVHDGCLAKYTCQLCRTQIETFMARLKLNATSLAGIIQSMPVIVIPPDADRRLDKEELLNCIAILFAIQRFPVVGGNKLFLYTCRYWLSCLIAILLRSASPVDHLYILSEVLRCPSDVGKWAGRLVQTCVPPRSQFACAHPATDLFIAQLSCLYMPVVAREEMLAKLKLKEPTSDNKRFMQTAGVVAGAPSSSFGSVRDSYVSEDWQMVDPESNESIALEPHKILPLSETDMLTLMSQFRFDDLFDAVYDVERFDRRYASEHDLLRLVIFTHQFLRVIETGLANPRHVGNYHHFTRRNAQLVRQTVLCLHACVMRFSSPDAEQTKLAAGLQLEYEQVILLAAQTLLRYPAEGSVQFLVGLPYEALTFLAQCRLWRIMKTCGTAPDELNNIVTADETKMLQCDMISAVPKNDAPQPAAIVQLEQLVDVKLGGSNALFLLIGFSDLARGITIDSSPGERVVINQRKQALITDIAYHIFYLSCLSVAVRDKLAKSGRDLLSTLARRHLFLISYLLKLVPEYVERIGAVAVNVVQELPFKLWQPDADDIAKLCSWLVDGLRVALENMHASQKLSKKGPLSGGTKNVEKLRELESKQKQAFRSCIEHLMARKILAQLDYGYRSPTAPGNGGDADDDLIMPQILHRRIALALLQAHLQNQAQLASSKSQSNMFSSMLSSAATSLMPATAAAVSGSTLKRGATIAASLLSSSSSTWDLHHVDYAGDYAEWCWQMLTRNLKLHPLVRSRCAVRRLHTNVVDQYDGTVVADEVFNGELQYKKALNAEHRDKLTCAVTLSMAPSYSHSSAAVLERSLDLLHLLVIDDDKIQFVLLILHQLVPLFFHNRQFVFLCTNTKFSQLMRCVIESPVLSSAANSTPSRHSRETAQQNGSVIDSIWQGISVAASGVASTLATTTGIGAANNNNNAEDVMSSPSTKFAVNVGDQRCALLAHQLLACYGSNNFHLCIVAWLRIVVAVQPRWWLNENVLSMVNVLSLAALSHEQHEVVIQELRSIYAETVQTADGGSGGSGVMSSLVSWASGSSNSTIADWAAPESTLKSHPIFALFALQAELNKTGLSVHIEDELIRQLNGVVKSSTTAESALKKALSAVKNNSSSDASLPAAKLSSLEQLPVIRWARALLAVDVAEPSFVLFTQCFFERFLSVPSGGRRPGGPDFSLGGGGTLHVVGGGVKSVGDRIFLTKSMLPLGKLLKSKLNAAQEYHYAQMTHLQSSQQHASTNWPVELHRRLYQLFRAMTFWLDEPRVHDAGGTAGLPADYLPTMIERCRLGPFYLWRDYLPLKLIDSCVRAYAESWQGPNFFRVSSQPTNAVDAARHRSPARAAPSSAPVSAVLGLPRALPPPHVPAFLSPLNSSSQQQLASIVVRDEDAVYLLSDPARALDKFRSTLTAVEHIAREQFERRSLLTSLDLDYLELVKELWHNVECSTTLSKGCGLRCSAPALLNVHFKESKRNEVAWSRAQQNRQQWQQQFLDEFNEPSSDEIESISSAGMLPTAANGSADEEPITDNNDATQRTLMTDSARNFVLAVVQLEALIAELIRRYNDARRAAQSSSVVDNLQAIGMQLFYLILSFVKEHTVQYEPAGSFLRSCLALLGQHFISNIVDQQTILLDALLRVCDEVSGASMEFKHYYAALLVECFSPMACVAVDSDAGMNPNAAVESGSVVSKTKLSNAAAFIQLYRTLSEAWQERKVPAAIVLQFLSRFSRAYTLTASAVGAAAGATLPRSTATNNNTAAPPPVSPIVSFFCSRDLTDKRRELMQLIVQTFTFGVRSARLDAVRENLQNTRRPSAENAASVSPDQTKPTADDDGDGKVRHLALQHYLSFVRVDPLQALYFALEKCYHAHQLLPAQLDEICMAMLQFSADGAKSISAARTRDSMALDMNWFNNNNSNSSSAAAAANVPQPALVMDPCQLATFLTDYFVQKRRHYWHGVGKRHRRSGGGAEQASAAAGATPSYAVGYIHHLQAYMPVLFAGPNCLFKVLATGLAEIERAPPTAGQHRLRHYGLDLLMRLFGALMLPLVDGELLCSSVEQNDDIDEEAADKFSSSPVGLRSSKSTVNVMPTTTRRPRTIAHAETANINYSPPHTHQRTAANTSAVHYANNDESAAVVLPVQLRHSQSLCNTGNALPPSRPPPPFASSIEPHNTNVHEQIDFPWTEPKRDEIVLLLKRVVELTNAACVVTDNMHATGLLYKGHCAQLVWQQFVCPIAQLWSTSSSVSSSSSSSAQQHHMLAAEKFYLTPLFNALTRVETWSFWRPPAEAWLMLTMMASCGSGVAEPWTGCYVSRHHRHQQEFQILLEALNTMPCEALARFALQIFIRLPLPEHVHAVTTDQPATSVVHPEAMFNESNRLITSAYFLLALHSAIRAEMLTTSERTSFLTHNMSTCAMAKVLGPSANVKQVLPFVRHFWALSVDRLAYEHACGMVLAELQRTVSAARNPSTATAATLAAEAAFFAELDRWSSIDTLMRFAGAFYADVSLEQLKPLMLFIINNAKKLNSTPPTSADRQHTTTDAVETRALRDFQASLLEKRTVFMQCRAVVLQRRLEYMLIEANKPGSDIIANVEATQTYLRNTLNELLYSVEIVSMTTSYVKQPHDIVDVNTHALRHEQMIGLACELLHALVNYNYSGASGATVKCIDVVLNALHGFWRLPTTSDSSSYRPLLLPFITAVCRSCASLNHMTQLLEWCIETFWSHVRFASIVVDPVRGFLASSLVGSTTASSSTSAAQSLEQKQSSLYSFDLVENGSLSGSYNGMNPAEIYDTIRPLIENALETPDLARHDFMLAARRQRALLLIHAYAEYRLLHSWRTYTVGEKVHLMQEVAMGLNFSSSTKNPDERPQPASADEMKVMLLIMTLVKICSLIASEMTTNMTENDALHWRDAVLTCLSGVVEQLNALCGEHQSGGGGGALFGLIGSAFKQQKSNYTRRFKMLVRGAVWTLASVIPPTHISAKLSGQVNEAFQTVRTKKEYAQAVPELFVVADRVQMGVAAVKKAALLAGRLKCARKAIVESLESTFVFARMTSSSSANVDAVTSPTHRPSASLTGGAVVQKTNSDNLLLSSDANNQILFEILMYKATADGL